MLDKNKHKHKIKETKSGENMSQVSKVFKICDAYESGLGHGFKNSIMKNPFDKEHEPELFEAYGVGYDSGKYKYEQLSSGKHAGAGAGDKTGGVAYAGHRKTHG